MLPPTVPSEILAAHGLSATASAPLGQGRINGTFRVGDRVLQVINPRVFPEPERVMDNLGAAGFYASAWGALPYTLSREPLDRYTLFEVVSATGPTEAPPSRPGA
ncbi:MAG TPA: hypothetical protein PKX64_03535 [Elusimicrobiota bacterium]|nr:hypothetical protein [Elusimicrobiota bacterium]